MTRHILYSLGLAIVLGFGCNDSTIDNSGNGNCTTADCADMTSGHGGPGGPDHTVGLGPNTPNPFNPGDDGSSGVQVDPNGNIILKPGVTANNKPVIWVAGSAEGTVSKIDTRTTTEIGRYYTFPGSQKGVLTADPSRTTVGLSGQVVVANRAWQFSANPANASAMSIAGDISQCVDRNGNGKIETSTNATPIPWPAGMANSPDECVLWINRDIGDRQGRPQNPGADDNGSRPRAAGFDAQIGLDGMLSTQVYIGLWGTRELVRIDAKTGKTLKRIDLGSVEPYGLVLDKNGDVWIRGAEGSLAKVSVKAGDQVKVYNGAKAPPCPYGITADAKGFIYTAGGTCVSRFDPATETWEKLEIPNATFTRGLAIDNTYGVWIADNQTGLVRVDGSGPKMIFNKLIPIAAEGGQATPTTLGVAIDFDLNPWIVSFSNSKVYKIDPKTNTVLGSVAVGANPYMYSDFSGFALRNAGTALGLWQHTFPGCGSNTRWYKLNWKVTNTAVTHVTVKIRSAATAAGLANVPFTTIANVAPDMSPIPIRLPAGASPDFLQVEFDLFSSDPKMTPILSGIDVGYSCNEIG